MSESPYYEFPRKVRTPIGKTADRITTTCTLLAALFLVVVWVMEVWASWTDHGVVMSVFSTIAITIYVAILGGIAFGMMVLGKGSVIGLAVAVGLIVWWWPSTALVITNIIPLALMAITGFAYAWRADEQWYRPVEPELLAQRVIGEPGADLAGALDKFGVENVAKGIAGEQLTSDEFGAHLDDVAPAQLINSLHFPGSETADVDHMIVLGNRVAILDSKYWSGGTYQWSGPGLIVSGRGHDLTARDTHFHVAAQRMSDVLTDEGKQVRAWIVVHGNDGRPIACTDPAAEHGSLPTLIAGTDWLPAVMEWLRSGQPTDTEGFSTDQCDTMKSVLRWKK